MPLDDNTKTVEHIPRLKKQIYRLFGELVVDRFGDGSKTGIYT